MSASTLVALVLGGLSSVQEAAVLELDHFFIRVERGAPEAAALSQAGFALSADTSHHTGQGTASLSMYFDNAYIELLWVTDAMELRAADPDLARRLLSADGEYAPFGVGLRVETAGEILPFETRSYRADWMLPGTTLELATTKRLEPEVFIVPDGMAWTDITAGAPPVTSVFPHGNGVATITALRFQSPSQEAPSEAFGHLVRMGVIEFNPGDDTLVEVELDGGRAGATADLRPTLPIVIQY